MKKFAVIGVSLLAALAVLTYVLLAGHSDDAEDRKETAPADTLSDNSAGAAATGSAGGEEADAALQLILEGPVRDSAKSGAKTKFDLYRGEIGYVDVDSILQDRDPYSIVALLQQHRAHTGAGELLELEIESTVRLPRGYSADFVQVIRATSTEARGTVAFDSSGAVYTVYGDLFDPEAAGVGNIVILQAEAEAKALEAARRFSEPRRVGFDERGEPLKMEASPGELRYALDPGNALRAEWRVPVSIYGPPFSVEVLVAAETGEVLNVKSLIVPAVASTGCSELTFRVCDASTMVTNSRSSCGEGVFDGGKPILDGDNCVAPAGQRDKCTEARYTGIRNNANKIRDYVKRIGTSAETDYLAGVGGEDCKVDILINVDTDLMERVQGRRADGQYDSEQDSILIREDYRDPPTTGPWKYPVFTESLIVHEVMHAVTQRTGDVEHGLVDGMEALHMGGDNDSNWTYGNKDFTKGQKIYGRDTHTVVGNAIYRIYKRMGAQHKDEVFRFALEVEKKRPTSLGGFRQELTTVARSFPEAFQRAVAHVLVEMGINDPVAGTVPISLLRFIAAKMRELALILPGDDDVAWVSAAAEEAEREIRRRLGLDNNQVLRNSRRRGG